jgi:hypothetical protein
MAGFAQLRTFTGLLARTKKQERLNEIGLAHVHVAIHGAVLPSGSSAFTDGF